MTKAIVIVGSNGIMAEGLRNIIAQDQNLFTVTHSCESLPSLISCRLPKPPEVIVVVAEVDSQMEDDWSQAYGRLGPTPTFALITSMILESQNAKLAKIGLRAVLHTSAQPNTILTTLSLLPRHKVIDTTIIVPDVVVSSRLTDRETQILLLLSQGFSVKDISNQLNVSVKTVEAHKFNLMRKLDIHNKADLARYATENLEST